MANACGTRGQFIFGEIEPGFTVRLTSTFPDRGHVVAVENDRFTIAVIFRQLNIGDRGECCHQVKTANNSGTSGIGFNMAGPAHDGRDAVATFAHGALGTTERRITGIRVNVLPCAVVGGPEDDGVVLEPQFVELVDDVPDAGIKFDHRVRIFRFGNRFVLKIGMRKVGLMNLHEVHIDEERRIGFLCRFFEELDRGFFNIAVKIGNADNTLVRGINILAIDFEIFGRFFTGLARQ